MPRDDMRLAAQQMVAPGKGILAADESTGTMNKRLSAENWTPPRRSAASTGS